MIKVEVQSSDDKDAIASYSFEFDEISIGHSLKNDIIIQERSWKDSLFQLKVTPNGLKIKSNENINFYLSNGKKISGSKIHQLEDIIGFNNTNFKILAFEKTTPDSPDILKLYQDRLSSNPELTNVLEAIESELRELE